MTRRVVLRKLTDHSVDPENEDLEVTVADEPNYSYGGKCHEYDICWQHPVLSGDLTGVHISFQYGVGNSPNGVTEEALLAIVIDRLSFVQVGTSETRVAALYHCRTALECLLTGTRERLARGVEDTNQK